MALAAQPRDHCQTQIHVSLPYRISPPSPVVCERTRFVTPLSYPNPRSSILTKFPRSHPNPRSDPQAPFTTASPATVPSRGPFPGPLPVQPVTPAPSQLAKTHNRCRQKFTRPPPKPQTPWRQLWLFLPAWMPRRTQLL